MFKCAFAAECRAVLRSLAFLWCMHTYVSLLAAYEWWNRQAVREREKERERYVFARFILRSPAPKCTYAGMLWLHFVKNDRVIRCCCCSFAFYFDLFRVLGRRRGQKICMRCLWGIISCVSFFFFSLLILLMFLSISFAPSYRFSAILIFVFCFFVFYSFIWCNNGCSWWQKMLCIFGNNDEIN